MATKSKATGFGVRCPFCGGEDATLTMDVNTLECHCGDCDHEFTVDEAVEQAKTQAARWEAVQRWVEMVPEIAAAATID